MTAFVGRTVKGPINRPVLLADFSAFQRVFGGLWQPSMLSYAVEQFFDNGGRQCLVVRVVNGGRAPGITLPAGRSALTLLGRSPGTREYLRASVDYDGIDGRDGDNTRFNLVVQRVHTPGSEFIEEQETFRRVSVDPGSNRFIADALTHSQLVRVDDAVPPERPERTPGSTGVAVGYVDSSADGDDGAPVTDYDLIGDAQRATGMFALRGAAPFNLLCLPPLGRDQDVGLPALLVAARLCRERQAMLIADPPQAWDTAEIALARLSEWPLRSEDALMYYPRISAFDRLRGRFESFGSAGAVAGMLARADDSSPLWTATQGDEGALRSTLRPASVISDTARGQLAQAGINVLPGVRTDARGGASPRTLVPENGTRSDGRYLAVRRFALFLMASIERGTRWVVLEHSGPPLWLRVHTQVLAFLAALDAEGAFAGATPEEKYFVICDGRLNGASEAQDGQFRLLFGFASVRPGQFCTCLVTQQAGASSVRPVSVNRLALACAVGDPTAS